MDTSRINMKYLWGWVFLFALNCSIWSQTSNAIPSELSMFINSVTGSKISFGLKNISSISFENGQIVIMNNDASTQSFAFANINYLDFGIDNSTPIETVALQGKNKLMLYPNPASDILHLQYAARI